MNGDNDRRESLLTALLFVLLVAAKDAQNLVHAEFYAEDGLVWYIQAYQQGIVSLANPVGGYLNTVQRLAALVALAVPLHWAPTVMNVFAAAAQVLLAMFLVSGRMADAWPGRRSRLLFALLVLAMPNARETFGILTNVHWYVALLAFLVLVSRPPRGAAGRAFDAAVLTLAGLSGPFCVFLLPVVFWQWRRQRNAATVSRGLILLLTAAIQIGYLLFGDGGRPATPLGATPFLLLKILALIPLGAQAGVHVIELLAFKPYWSGAALPAAAGLLCIAVFALGWLRGNRLVRQFLLFTLLMFAGALYKPAIDEVQAQWPLIAGRPPAGGRYFLFPMIAWWGILFALAAEKSRVLRLPALALLLCTLLYAIPRDWPAWGTGGAAEFQARAREFERAPVGTRMVFRIKPAGVRPMVLVKQ